MRKLLLGLAVLSMSAVLFVACNKSEAPATDEATPAVDAVVEPVKTEEAAPVVDAEAPADAETPAAETPAAE